MNIAVTQIMPPALMREQQQLIKLIFSEQNLTSGSKFDARGIAIYRNNLLETAVRALGISFPTVQKLVGEDVFRFAALQLLKVAPPDKGDWAMWGEQLPAVLESIEALDGFVYVPDSARLDWAIHQVSRARDCQFKMTSIRLLQDVELDKLFISQSDCTQILTSDYPVYQAWKANHASEPEGYIDEFKQRIASEQFQQYLAVYRVGYKPDVLELSADDYQFFRLLKRGYSIGTALELLDKPDFAFDSWLTQAIKHNLIYAFTKIN
ncbi:DNA-binding domain-containing protein [Neptunicella marina]|uniref:Putative DNA-binding domain-containing protein n=1 Tax=Neptunicella marina TaxID=2125989 RepID=A0A8J6IX85_9ALTE|nr:DNA-binding domain-containing protein [Neptunicella marina]MBC3767187.1 putative DNA-binding domain-containing protein [Neptunicella marina]